MAPGAVLAQTDREAILTWEDYDLTVEQACARSMTWRPGCCKAGRWCGAWMAVVSACGDGETLEFRGFNSNHAEFLVDGVGFGPCEDVPVLAEPAADKAFAATTLQQTLEELILQICIQFAACCKACKDIASPYGCWGANERRPGIWSNPVGAPAMLLMQTGIMGQISFAGSAEEIYSLLAPAAALAAIDRF